MSLPTIPSQKIQAQNLSNGISAYQSRKNSLKKEPSFDPTADG